MHLGNGQGLETIAVPARDIGAGTDECQIDSAASEQAVDLGVGLALDQVDALVDRGGRIEQPGNARSFIVRPFRGEETTGLCEKRRTIGNPGR
jgi:hypothetical protein